LLMRVIDRRGLSPLANLLLLQANPRAAAPRPSTRPRGEGSRVAPCCGVPLRRVPGAPRRSASSDHAAFPRRPPAGPGWMHEVKHDGYRIVAPYVTVHLEFFRNVSRLGRFRLIGVRANDALFVRVRPPPQRRCLNDDRVSLWLGPPAATRKMESRASYVGGCGFTNWQYGDIVVSRKDW
jgi:hypothetical protein